MGQQTNFGPNGYEFSDKLQKFQTANQTANQQVPQLTDKLPILELADWLSLVLICRRCICDVAAGNTWDTFRTNQNMRLRQLEPGIAELYRRHAWEVELESLSQRRSHAGGKDWDEQCCQPLLFSYRNGIPGGTGGHVEGASAAC